MSYYDTVDAEHEDLKMFRAKAERQDDIILGYFNDAKVLSPSEAEVISNQDGYSWPLTSVRRSIHTLTRKGVIDKTDMKREGSFGRNEYIWQLREEE